MSQTNSTSSSTVSANSAGLLKAWVRGRVSGLVLLALADVLAGAVLGWWGIVLPSAVAGALRPEIKRINWVASTVGALTWIVVAAIEDASVDWRISARLGGVLGVHVGWPLYVLLAAVAGLICWLAAQIAAQALRLSGYRILSP